MTHQAYSMLTIRMLSQGLVNLFVVELLKFHILSLCPFFTTFSTPPCAMFSFRKRLYEAHDFFIALNVCTFYCVWVDHLFTTSKANPAWLRWEFILNTFKSCLVRLVIFTIGISWIARCNHVTARISQLRDRKQVSTANEFMNISVTSAKLICWRLDN